MASPAAPCVFCDIVAGKAPAYVVYQDERTVAFLDLFPVTRGHVLVVPKAHRPRLTDLPESEYGDLLRALSRVCRTVERLSSDYNVTLNQGARAGQIVFHLHFHIIPRYGEAGPWAPAQRTRLVEGDARRIIAELAVA